MAFSFWKALGYGVGRVRERPAEAVRIWAVDALVVCAVPAAWVALGVLYQQFPSLMYAVILLAVLPVAIMVMGWICSEAAWARFLGTDRPASWFPYRLGRDEGRIFESYAILGFIFATVGVLIAAPILIVGRGLSAGGIEMPALVQLTPLLVALVVVFVAARIAVVAMLVVRRQVFSPLSHFAATDPFWFRLGLAFLAAIVLMVTVAQGLPSFLSNLAGIDPPVRPHFTMTFPYGWMMWLERQDVLDLRSVTIALLGVSANCFDALVTRGIAAHAALNALEQDEMDARRAFPAADRASQGAGGS